MNIFSVHPDRAIAIHRLSLYSGSDRGWQEFRWQHSHPQHQADNFSGKGSWSQVGATPLTASCGLFIGKLL